MNSDMRARADGSGWRAYVGDAGACVGLEHSGASADYKKLYAEFASTAERAAQAALASFSGLARADGLG